LGWIQGVAVNLIYIGEEFYYKSGTRMSSIYQENGQRSDWAAALGTLSRGESVHIRPATEKEIDHYKARLLDLLEAK
jgi:hypothetical protein